MYVVCKVESGCIEKPDRYPCPMRFRWLDNQSSGIKFTTSINGSFRSLSSGEWSRSSDSEHRGMNDEQCIMQETYTIIVYVDVLLPSLQAYRQMTLVPLHFPLVYLFFTTD